MRTILLILLCFVLSAFDTTAQSLPPDAFASVSLPSAIERVLRDYEQAWEAREARALSALFAPRGFVFGDGHPPVRDPAAVEEAYRDSGRPLHLRPLAFEQSGPVASVIGGYSARPEVADGGKFVLALREETGGRWVIVADIDNRNR